MDKTLKDLAIALERQASSSGRFLEFLSSKLNEFEASETKMLMASKGFTQHRAERVVFSQSDAIWAFIDERAVCRAAIHWVKRNVGSDHLHFSDNWLYKDPAQMKEACNRLELEYPSAEVEDLCRPKKGAVSGQDPAAVSLPWVRL
jgi:hypothetical protein